MRLAASAALTYSTSIYQPGDKLTDEQRNLWFTDQVDGLYLTEENVVTALKAEIQSPSDLLGMKADDIDSINTTISTSTSDQRGRAQPKYRLPHRTVMRLKGMIRVVNYLSLVRRDITWDSIRWTTVLRFNPEWDALVTSSEKDPAEVPKYRASTGMPRHMLNLVDYLRTTYGSTYCVLHYLVCDDSLRDDTAPEDAPTLVEGRLFAEPHTRIADEIRARASRSTAAAQADNEQLFRVLVSSFSGSSNLAALAEEFENTRDGVGFWIKLQETQCTDDAHRRAGEGYIKWLMTCIWGGPQDGQLTKHVEKHRRQYALYVQACEHCVLQKYTDRTRVGWLLRSITSTDTNIAIRKNAILDDDSYLDDFERTAIYLAKTEYEGRDKKGTRRVRIQESDVSGLDGDDTVSSPRKKPRGVSSKQFNKMLTLNEGKGPSGVEYRWHEKKEYDKLPAAQKKDLNQWRATKGITIQRRGSRGKGGEGGGGGTPKNVSATTTSRLDQLTDSIATLASVVMGLPGIKESVAAATATAERQKAAAAIQALTAQASSAAGTIGSVTLAPPTAGETTAAASAGTAQISGTQVQNTSVNQSEDAQALIESDIAAATSVGAQAILSLKSICGLKKNE